MTSSETEAGAAECIMYVEIYEDITETVHSKQRNFDFKDFGPLIFTNTTIIHGYLLQA